jgi:hypothetical protein
VVHPISSLSHVVHGQRHGVRPVPSLLPCYEQLATQYHPVGSYPLSATRRRTVERHCSTMSTGLADALVMCEHALEICEPSCMSRAVKSFFIFVPPQHAESCGTHGSIGAPASGRQGPEACGTWQRRSHLLWGSGVQSRGARGGTGAHLSLEVRPGAAGHMTMSKPSSTGRSDLKLQNTWQCRSPPRQGGEVQV